MTHFQKDSANPSVDPIERYRFALLALILLAAVGFASPWFARAVYHSDEYRTMGRSLALLGGDIFLEEIPSQKPPLFYMVLASVYGLLGVSETVGITVGTLSSLGILVAVFLLGERLWDGTRAGLLAALLVALAPMEILFTPTLFLDPPMILLGLLAWLAAAYGRPPLTGFLLGLAFATKQQGILFAGLALPTLFLLHRREGVRPLVVAAAAMLGTGGLAILWSAGNTEAPFHFLAGQIENEQKIIGKSLLVLPWQEGWGILATRFAGWWQVLEVSTIAPRAALVGLGVLLLFVIRPPDPDHPDARPRRGIDLLLLLWICAIVALHVVVRFRLIDRYLLPVVPVLALANARVLVAGLADKRRWIARGLVPLILLFVLIATATRLPQLDQVGVLENGRRIGVLWRQRTDMKMTLQALDEIAAPDDVIACEHYVCHPARFWLWPRTDVPQVFDAIELLQKPGQRRFIVWAAERNMDRLMESLGDGYTLVQRGARFGHVRILEVVDAPASNGP